MVDMVADRLRELRMKAQLTQREVSETTGIAASSLCQYETGIVRPPVDSLVKLAILYNCSTDYLLGVTHTHTVSVDGLDELEVALVEHTINVIRRAKGEAGLLKDIYPQFSPIDELTGANKKRKRQPKKDARKKTPPEAGTRKK